MNIDKCLSVTMFYLMASARNGRGLYNLRSCFFVCIAAGDALVSSGIMESLLQVLDWKAFEPMNITVSNTIHVHVANFLQLELGRYSDPL